MIMTPLSITLIQSDLHWEQQELNRHHFGQLIDALTERTDLIVLPEMFTTGFSMRPAHLAEQMKGPTAEWMYQKARQKNAAITGSIIVKENNRFYNRLLWVQPDGQLHYYDKRHLFRLSQEPLHYTAGKEKLIINWRGWKICPMICYDLRFPVWCRNVSLQEKDTPQAHLSMGGVSGAYDLLLFVANWPERRNTAWKTLLQARAIENQAYVAGVNRIGFDGHHIYHSGDSCLIDPSGEVIFTQSDLPFIHTFSLSKERLRYVREKYPFLPDADKFKLIK